MRRMSVPRPRYYGKTIDRISATLTGRELTVMGWRWRGGMGRGLRLSKEHPIDAAHERAIRKIRRLELSCLGVACLSIACLIGLLFL